MTDKVLNFAAEKYKRLSHGERVTYNLNILNENHGHLTKIVKSNSDYLLKRINSLEKTIHYIMCGGIALASIAVSALLVALKMG